MPAVADLPPKHSAVVVASQPEAQGQEGRYISKAGEFAALHWERRAERLVTEAVSTDEDYGYESVPLAIVGSIRVRCHFIGPLKPMPYEWDE